MDLTKKSKNSKNQGGAIRNQSTRNSPATSLRGSSTPSFVPGATTNQHAQGSENESESSRISLSTPYQEPAKRVTSARGRRIRDRAIAALDFASTLSGAMDLLKPVKAVSDAIKKVLELRKEMEDVDANWLILEKRLKFHLATLDSQQALLEEDETMDGSTPEPSPEVKKILENYRRELNDICLLLSEVAPSGRSAAKRAVDINRIRGLITQRCQDLDDIFNRYTTSLQILVASTVSRVMDGIQQLDEKIEREADKTHENHLKGHNVYGHQHVPCLQGTRIETLKAIRRWVDNQESPQWMFCLLDVAGSGKSTVAKHMAEEWRKESGLVARFFFSRDTTETMSTNRFCSTVAELFAAQSTVFKGELDKFKDRPDLSFEERFEEMITTPLKAHGRVEILKAELGKFVGRPNMSSEERFEGMITTLLKAHGRPAILKAELDKFVDLPNLSLKERFEGMIMTLLKANGRPAILTIDALDECNNQYQSRDQLLRTLAKQRKSIPQLRVLVTGRPETDIKLWAEASGGYTNFGKLEGGSRDVELYIESRLQSIPIDDRRRLYSVIQQAEGLFIWARIACDLLMKTSDVEGLLEILGQEVSLDYLYRIALEQSIPKDKASRQATLIILQMILAAKRPLSVAELEKLAPKSRIVEPVVASLGSFLLYDGREGSIRLLHATFREYVTDRSKQSPIFAQIGLGHHFLASGCINLVEEYLKEEVDLLEMDEISKRTFLYSAESCIHHYLASNHKLALNEHIMEFMDNRLEAWLVHAKKWYEINLDACIENLLSLSRQKLSLVVNQKLVKQSIKWITMEMNYVEKREEGYWVDRRDTIHLEKKKMIKILFTGWWDGKSTVPLYEKYLKEFEEIQASFPMEDEDEVVN